MARTYRATINCTGVNGVLCQPSLHYQTDVPTGGGEPNPDDVADGIWTVINTTFRACCPSFLTVHNLVVSEEVLAPDIGVGGVKIVELAGTHAGTGDSMPEGAVPVINRHTGTRSRSARGWLHLPSPHWADDVSYNNWSSGFLSTLNAFAAKLDDSFDLGTVFITHVNPVVYSRKRRRDGSSPYTFRVTNATANPQPHWLRSRMSTP